MTQDRPFAEDGARMVALMDSLDWSVAALASRLNVDERLIRRWRNGQNAIPAPVLPWLERIAAGLAAEPVPHGWEV